MDCPDQNVLLVDPDPNVLALLRSALESCQVATEQVSCGRDALARLHEERFCLVILEMDLPDMSGFQLAHTIQDRHPHQTIGFFSSWNCVPQLDDFPSLKSMQFFSKSEVPQLLLVQILMSIRHGHSVRELQRQHTAMEQKLSAVRIVERMVGRYAERWRVDPERARRIITDYCRSQRLSVQILAGISETRNTQVQEAEAEFERIRERIQETAKKQLERVREDINKRLKDDEPGVLFRLDQYYKDPPASRKPNSRRSSSINPPA